MAKTDTQNKIKLKLITVPIQKVHENPWNVNRQTERTFEAEKESINRYGFIDPLTVREHPELKGEYQVIDGAHRLMACQQLGFSEIAINVLEGISDAEAKKLSVVLNEVSGEADKVELSKLLAEIQLDLGEDLIVGLPYNSEQLTELLNFSEVDWNQLNEDNEEDLDRVAPEDFKEYDNTIQTEHTCPKCGFHF